MKKKNFNNSNGIIFSTNPDFKWEKDEKPDNEIILPSAQKLKVRLDTRHRAGKSVTLITGFVGEEVALQGLGKSLKDFCGTGGSVKDEEIIVQGDQREKVMQWLLKNGFEKAKMI